MTINADGASSEIILQQNGTEIGRIGSGFAGTSGQVLTSNGAGAAPTMQAGGKVLQVVSTTKTTSFSTSSNTYVDITGLSASITPSSISSKILCVANISSALYKEPGAYDLRGMFQCLRDSTAIDDKLLQITTDGAGRLDTRLPVTMERLDSPSSTSELTYKVKVQIEDTNGQSCTLFVNNNSTRSTITLMEIGA